MLWYFHFIHDILNPLKLENFANATPAQQNFKVHGVLLKVAHTALILKYIGSGQSYRVKVEICEGKRNFKYKDDEIWKSMVNMVKHKDLKVLHCYLQW